MANTVHDFTVQSADGTDTSMADFAGNVLLIVNVASKCGFTKQYAGLEKLYQDHKDAGLEIIGFPCNQFGGQEPGTNEEIQQFCSMNYGVSFPVMAKIDVNGKNAHPLWQHLKDSRGGLFGDAIKWNFTKFLVDREGQVLERFAPKDTPEDIEPAIVEALSR